MTRLAATVLLLTFACGGGPARAPAPIARPPAPAPAPAPAPPSLDDPATRDEALDDLEEELARATSITDEQARLSSIRALADRSLGDVLRVWGTVDDVRFRGRLLDYLVQLHDPRTIAWLEEVVLSPEPTFQLRRDAMEGLGTFHDPTVIPTAIRGLFLFGADPTERMDDVAARTLAAIGRPAVEPLLRVLRGQDEEAQALAAAYVVALRQESPDSQLRADQLLVEEASSALGILGDPSAFDGLVAVARRRDPALSIAAVVALADLDLAEPEASQVRGLLESRYASAPLESKAELLSTMRARIDPRSLPFLERVARDRRASELLRVLAFDAAVSIALGPEARPLEAIELSDRSVVESRMAVLELSRRCARDVECWLAEAGSEHVDVLEKVAYALGRLGHGDPRALSSLRALVAHPEVRVRLAALAGLDRAGAGGEAVRAIAALRDREAGQPSWAAFATAALPAMASFAARARRALNEEPEEAEAAAPTEDAPDRRPPPADDRPRR